MSDLTRKGTPFYRFSRVVVAATLRLFFRLKKSVVQGAANIPAEGGFILASNHASHLDPPVLAVASPRPLTFMAKKELFTNPLFSALIKSLGAYPVDRGGSDRGAIQMAIGLLQVGRGLVIFPEGTRTSDGEVGELKSGAALLSLRAGAPIVPAYIKGTFAAFPRGGPIRRAPVSVIFGEPLDPSAYKGTPGAAKAMTRDLDASIRNLSGS